MAFLDALDVIATDLALAAGDVSGRTIAVVRYEPDTINKDHVAFWPVSLVPSHTGAETLTKLSLERGVFIQGVLWSGAGTRTPTQAAQLEDDISTLALAIWSRLYADSALGGNAIGLYIDEARVGWLSGGDNQLGRTVEMTVMVDMSEEISRSL